MSAVITRSPESLARRRPPGEGGRAPSHEPRAPAAESTAIRSATVTAVYLFDVADEIDLARLRDEVGVGAAQARFQPKPATPAYVQYHGPPLVLDGEAIGAPPLDGFRTRVKFFDYGIVSVALSRRFGGSWVDLIALGQDLMENDRLEDDVERVCAALVERHREAVDGERASVLSEDYLVFAVHELDEPLTADELVERHGDEIALLLRGERYALSRQERDEVLRHRLSYLADDLVVPTWNAAFVYDTEAGAKAALEILEFANSQLLQYRYYDELLDQELERLYATGQRPRWYHAIAGRRHTRAARHLHALIIEVNGITDKTENALKMVGDIYAARLFNLVAPRLGLERWKQNLEDKLKTLDDIYRFAVDQTDMSRGHLLEIMIILILLVELVLWFMGVIT